MLEKCCSSLPQSCRMLEKCRSILLRSHRWLEMAARACPGAAAGSKWPLKPAPEPQNSRKVLLKPGPEPQNAREVCCSSLPRSRRMLQKCRSSLLRSHRMLEKCRSTCPGATAGSRSAARAHSREVRSFLALEKCCLLFVCYRQQLLLSSTLLRRARSCWGVRIGRSSPLGLAAPPTRQSRTKMNRPGQAKPTRRRFAGRGRGCLLHSEPARPRWGARIGRSSPLGLAGALDRTEPNENEPNQTGQAYSETRACPGATAGSKSAARAHSREVRSFLALEKCFLLFVCYRPPLLLSSTLLRRARSCWGVRIGRSSPLGFAAPSTRQSRTKTNRPGQAKPTRRRFAGRGRGCLLHSEPARPRWGARIGRSSPLGLGEALDRTEPNENEPNQTGDRPSLLGDASLGRTTDACCTQHRDEHTPCIECTGTH